MDAEIREIPAVKAVHEQAVNLVLGGGEDGEDGKAGNPLGTTTARFQPENEIRGLPEGAIYYKDIFN